MAKTIASSLCLLILALQVGCGACVPRPSVTSVSPSSATAGDLQFLLTVNGDDFRRNSEVSWNGSFRVTSFVSSHQLVATISAADIAQPGTLFVMVFNPPEQRIPPVSGAIAVSPLTMCNGKTSNSVPFIVHP